MIAADFGDKIITPEMIAAAKGTHPDAKPVEERVERVENVKANTAKESV